MRNTLIACVAALALSAPAFAQDAARDGATMAGFRIEARAGYDNPRLTVAFDDGVDSFKETDGTDGVVYGGEIGYDVPLGYSTAGVYAGLDFANTDFCSEVYGQDEACIEAGRNITVGIRGASQVSANALLYVKGGYSNGRLRLSYEDFEDILEDVDASVNVEGFHLGAGGEIGFGSNTYAKLEYVYTDYDGDEFEGSDFTAGADLSRHQIMAGFGVRF